MQGLSRQVKSRLDTIDHDNKHSSEIGSAITTLLSLPFINDQHQHLSPQPHPPLTSLPFPPPSHAQFSPGSSKSPLFHVGGGGGGGENPEQFQLGLNQRGVTGLWESGGEGANISEIFLQGLGEDSTFQGLDATVSGGYLFGWPDGPVY